MERENVLTSERLRNLRKTTKIAEKRDALKPLGINEGQLTPVKEIRYAYDHDEVRFYIVYGPHGYGKSAYLASCLAQLNGTWEWGTLKKFLIWEPEMLVKIIEYVEKSGHDEMMLGCDDAGVWLNAMKWNHPFLAALTEYFDVIRMHFHGIMFTSPLPMHVIKRIRGLPQSVNIRIDKVEGGGGPEKYRHATGYNQYLWPDLKHTRVSTSFIDTFSAVMPKKFYDEYYNARKTYTTKAYEHVKSELKKWRKLEPQTIT